jgi:hypothetical protein
MKRYYIFVILFLVPFLLKGQRYVDYGISAGASSYLGDINPMNFFYKPSPAGGAFFRINLNKRYAVRVNTTYMNLRGSSLDFPDIATHAPLATFSETLVDFNGQMEFNFLPYITGEEKFMNSFYVSAGMGYTIFLSAPNTLSIPFGVGFKINLTDRLSGGLEWCFRRTFTDSFDSVSTPLDNTLFNNNDWYSFYGLFISYKFVKFAADCPVYK